MWANPYTVVPTRTLPDTRTHNNQSVSLDGGHPYTVVPTRTLPNTRTHNSQSVSLDGGHPYILVPTRTLPKCKTREAATHWGNKKKLCYDGEELELVCVET